MFNEYNYLIVRKDAYDIYYENTLESFQKLLEFNELSFTQTELENETGVDLKEFYQKKLVQLWNQGVKVEKDWGDEAEGVDQRTDIQKDANYHNQYLIDILEGWYDLVSISPEGEVKEVDWALV